MLIKLWKFFRYICGERLVPLLRANIDVISRKRRFGITPEIKEKLLTISRSTVERPLTEERKKHKLKGKSTTQKDALLKNQMPVRKFWAWDENSPVSAKLTPFRTTEGVKSARITPGPSLRPMWRCAGLKPGR